MTNNSGQPEVSVETASVFHVDLLKEMESSSNTNSAVFGAGGLPADSVLLVVERGPNASSRFLLDQAVTAAGRHPDSDIFLDDVTVSRRHTEFRKSGDPYEAVDMGSLNDTYVNREPKNSAVLANGNEVRVGKLHLVFLIGD